ncbi:uncharacterized protein LOC133725138 [Rosa rugosa]|uniref:uncharacterized protein LOC133725138 n=1 Tax=Rosa rugosa TaxID=74645 RepID=UPI002B41579F|nr:uncharacterized protein LOC133725138 [Rosa rugosa]
MGQVSSSRPQPSNDGQEPSRVHAPNAERQSTNTSQGERRQSVISSEAILSQSHPLDEDQGHTRLRILDAERQRRTNYQREKRQSLNSSQRAESLARRRANYHLRRQSRNTSVENRSMTNQLEAMAGNLLQ